MTHTEADQALWVVESNGAPRSGKGTITSGLAEAFPGADQDETGADYRAVTYGLIEDGHIDVEMPTNDIGSTLEKLGVMHISEYAASRLEIPTAELYEPRINDTVSKVSPHDVVRGAVKKGFARRVEKRVKDDEIRLLFVDGRNLTPVIEGVTGANLLLRIFVDCQPFLAAQREGLRDGSVNPHDSDYNDWYLRTVESIRKRQQDDENREHDPVKKEENAIDYWFNHDLLHETGLHVANDYNISLGEATTTLASGRGEDYRRGGRYGAGAKAAAEDRQVYFDTSEIGRDAMLRNAERMVEEALEFMAGRYKPMHEGLLKPKSA